MEAETGSIIIRQSTEAFEELPFLGLLLALFAFGNLVHYYFMALYLAVLCPVFGCCLSSPENWILWVMPWCSGVHCLARSWLHVPSECCLYSVGSIGRLSGYWRNAWLDSGYIFCISTWLLNDIRTSSTWLRT